MSQIKCFLVVIFFALSVKVRGEIPTPPKEGGDNYGRGYASKRTLLNEDLRLNIGSDKIEEFCKNLRAKKAKENKQGNIASADPSSCPELATPYTLAAAILLDIQKQATDPSYTPLLNVGAAAKEFEFNKDLSKDQKVTLVEFGIDIKACRPCQGFRNYKILEETVRRDKTKTIGKKVLSLDYFGIGVTLSEACGKNAGEIYPKPQFILTRNDMLSKFSSPQAQYLKVPDTTNLNHKVWAYHMFLVDDQDMRDEFHADTYATVKKLNPNAVEANGGH